MQNAKDEIQIEARKSTESASTSLLLREDLLQQVADGLQLSPEELRQKLSSEELHAIADLLNSPPRPSLVGSPLNTSFGSGSPNSNSSGSRL